VIRVTFGVSLRQLGHAHSVLAVNYVEEMLISVGDAISKESFPVALNVGIGCFARKSRRQELVAILSPHARLPLLNIFR
jgi:uncharacterized protein (UPF0218 family)